MKTVVCAVLLVCVLIIVIAPQVDLPPTALRLAQRLIVSLLIQLAALTLLFAGLVQADRSDSDFTALRETSPPSLLSRLSIICVRRC